MRLKINVLLLFALLLSPAVLSEQEQEAASTAVANLSVLLQSMQSISAHFEQQLLDDEGNTLQKASGEMLIKRPRRFHWRTTGPYEQLLVTDGDVLWLYDIDLEQITRQRFSSELENAPALLLSGDTVRISEKYDVVRTTDEEGVLQFNLIPKDSSGMFQGFTIGFRDGVLISMSVRDNFDQLSMFQFTQLIVNPEIPDDMFQFKAPEGVDVISNDR